ncbi:DNA topoisomerase 2-alpha [Acipenser ruthenus]|uniref:DNA topoisomerase 2-alpha n=1 Tax=Acipenser ruthenus TaxID=7906 RepID=A0A444UHU5_ACIRT|nr:DNA topoisomerase 2-alpha [Acipenser ruthenus]
MDESEPITGVVMTGVSYGSVVCRVSLMDLWCARCLLWICGVPGVSYGSVVCQVSLMDLWCAGCLLWICGVPGVSYGSVVCRVSLMDLWCARCLLWICGVPGVSYGSVVCQVSLMDLWCAGCLLWICGVPGVSYGSVVCRVSLMDLWCARCLLWICGVPGVSYGSVVCQVSLMDLWCAGCLLWICGVPGVSYGSVVCRVSLMDLWCARCLLWICGVSGVSYGSVVCRVSLMDLWCVGCLLWICGVSGVSHGSVVCRVSLMDLWCAGCLLWICGVSGVRQREGEIMENTEINNIIKIMGLQYKKNYAEPDSLKTLRYGKIMIMTDQAFSKKMVDDRKEWLTNFMEGRRQRRLHGLPEDFLYGQSTKHLTYNDFINKELVLFSNSDNERSIPSVVDGLKPGQRKVLFTCFKRNDKREVKVAQLAGSVAEMSAYHHGEVSLMMTIINLAQNFIGSNNLNLLQPVGQFGTRLHGGKDAASPRYIFTMLSPLARLLFPAVDDNLLKNTYDDNQKVEPEWYVPIIPTVLLNGAEGIGTGWACRIPHFDVREVINNMRRMLEGEEPLPMLPSYKTFKGTVQELGPNQYLISGEISVLDSTSIEISELPAKTWTQTYKEQVLEPMLNGTEKTQPLITDYREYHTDTTVRFVVKMAEEKLAEAEAAGLHKVFKLQTPLTCNSMVMFDHVGCMKKYETVQDILKEFFDLRVKYYDLRKGWLLGMLGAENAKLTNQARFILEKIEGTLVIGDEPLASGPDYNYLLNMPLWYLTKEKKEELCKQRDAKGEDGVVMKMEFEESGAGDNLAQNSPERGESLATRLTKKSQKETGAQGGAKGKKQMTLPFKPVKKEKRNPWLDSSEPEPSDSEAAPRERVPRRATATKVKRTIDSSSEDDFEGWGKAKSSRKDDESDHEEVCPAPESDTAPQAPEPKKKQKSHKPPKEKALKEVVAPKSEGMDLTSQDSEEGEAVQSKPSAPPAKPVAQKEKAAGKKTLGKKPSSSTTVKKKGSDDKQPSILDALTKPKAPAPKTSRSTAAAGPSSSSDSEPKPSKVTSTAVKKHKAARKRESSGSEESGCDLMSRIKGKPAANKKAKTCADDESFKLQSGSESDTVAPRSKPGRAKKVVQYLASASDSDFGF